MAEQKTTASAPQQTAPTATPLSLDPNLIAAIVAAVVQALPKSEAAGIDYDKLGQVLGASVANGIAGSTRRKVTFGEYSRSGHSPFHPKPFDQTPILKRRCWQNGVWANPTTLTDNEIVLLNQITHGGRYIDRRVEVVMRQNGSQEEVEIRFKNKSVDDQIAIKGYAKSFEDMLQQIVKVQKEEDAENEGYEQDRRDARAARRTFGENKATKEARERAGVDA